MKSDKGRKLSKENTTHRSIREPIQLVTQSNAFRFVTSDTIQTDPLNARSFTKQNTGDSKPYLLDSSGRFFKKNDFKKTCRAFKHNPEYISRIKEHEIVLSNKKAVQKITTLHIYDGFYATNAGPEDWPKRLYLKIPLSISTEDAVNSLIRKYGFCYFPHGEDSIDIANYKENDYYLEKMTPLKGIPAINWLHLYRKLFRLTEIVQHLESVTESDRTFLEKEVQKNVLSIRVPSDNFARREIQDFEGCILEKQKGTPFSFFSDNTLENTISAYRVFGHFALCCFELLTDIKNTHRERFCAYTLCKSPLPYDIHAKINTCNSECKRHWRTEQRRVERDAKSKNILIDES